MPQPSTATSRVHRDTRRRQRLLWWADAAVIVCVCLLIAGAHLVAEGVTFAVVAPRGWAVAFIGLKVGARAEYRRGWHHGYESATRAIVNACTANPRRARPSRRPRRPHPRTLGPPPRSTPRSSANPIHE